MHIVNIYVFVTKSSLHKPQGMAKIKKANKKAAYKSRRKPCKGRRVVIGGTRYCVGEHILTKNKKHKKHVK
jgi:hypothetical protein